MNLAFFALRNLGRSIPRTSLQVGGIGVVTAIMLVWGCLNTGLEDLLQKSATDLDVGELQIHAPGYVASPDLYKTLPYTESWMKQLRGAGFNAAPRVYGFALAGAGNLSAGIQVRGVDLRLEPNVTEVNEAISQGQWLVDTSPSDVVIGRILARRLHIKVGDDIVVLAQAADGSAANAIFHVRGILSPVSDDIDSRAVYMPMPTFQQYFRLQAGIHEIALRRVDKSQPLIVARDNLTDAVKKLHASAEVSTWRQLKPILAKMLDILSVSSKFIFAFIYLSLGGLIVNIAFMTIYDRLTEFGTMTALGMMPNEVLRLILAESAWLALFNAIVAWAVGMPIALLLERHGLDLRLLYDHWSMAGVTIKPILYPRIGLYELITPVAFMFVSLIVFCVYPGLDAARMPSVKALTSR